MADFVFGEYIVKGPKEKLDKLYETMQSVIKSSPEKSSSLSDLESALREVKAHPMPTEANFPMLYSSEETKPNLEDGEVESAFCERDDFYHEVERTEDALKFNANTIWYDRSGDICAMIRDYCDDDVKISYFLFDGGDVDYDDTCFTNDHELFGNWLIEGNKEDHGISERFVKLSDALRRIEELIEVKIPDGMKEVDEIREWLRANYGDIIFGIYRIN